MPKRSDTVRFTTTADRKVFMRLKSLLDQRKRGETIQSEIRRFLAEKTEQLAAERGAA